MIKARLVISAALTLSMLTAPVMATDFYALGALQGVSPTALQDSALAGTEGGASCWFSGSNSEIHTTSGSVCIISVLSGDAPVTVANELPLTGNFLQITDGL